MNTTMLAAILAALLGCAADAAAQVERCANDAPRQFVGNPFTPWACPDEIGKPVPPAAEAPAPKGAKQKAPDKKAYLPDALFGGWEGIAVHWNRRYELHADVHKLKRGFAAYWMAMNYDTHFKHLLSVEAKAGWTAGRFSAVVKDEAKPETTLKASVRFGPVQPGSPYAGSFDRQATVSYADDQPEHVVFFRLDGPNKLVYLYEDRSGIGTGGSAKPVKVEGVLLRSEQ